MKLFTENKKPIQFCIGFLFFMGFAQAQELGRTRKLLEQKDYARAKESVDSFVTINNNSAEGWLLKSMVYAAIEHDPATRPLVADAGAAAFGALQKAGSLDMIYVSNVLKADNYSLPLKLYDGFTNDGLMLFNAGAERDDKNSYRDALASFKKAGMVSSYMYSNAWIQPAIDTVNLYYSAKAAISSDKEEDAEFYSKKIIDYKVTTISLQASLESIYQWMVYNYKTRQDWEQFNRYAAAGMAAFPVSSYFTLSYIDWYRLQNDYPNLFNQYRQLFKKEGNINQYRLDYYKDMYNYLYQANPHNADKRQYGLELVTGLTKYLQQNKTSAEARLLLGKFYINQATVLYKQINEQKNTRAILKARATNNLKKSNQFLLEIVNTFSSNAEPVYKEALGLLIANFRILQMPKEVRKYQLLLSKPLVILHTLLIFILILLNIILIIGILIL